MYIILEIYGDDLLERLLGAWYYKQSDVLKNNCEILLVVYERAA